jgi:5S rRNA maturation endonuclease (ribonuclease M5)
MIASALRRELLDLLERKRTTLALVEGKRDVAALHAFGFTQVRSLDGPLYRVVEGFEKGETVQLLVDLDREGKKLYAALKADLTQRGVRIDDELREALFKTELRQIEGLDTYLAEYV